MSAPAGREWSSNQIGTTAEMALPAPAEEIAMREKLNVVRDTMIVFGIQIVFRAMLLLRRLNF
jgi:hypothetical protein